MALASIEGLTEGPVTIGQSESAVPTSPKPIRWLEYASSVYCTQVSHMTTHDLTGPQTTLLAGIWL